MIADCDLAQFAIYSHGFAIYIGNDSSDGTLPIFFYVIRFIYYMIILNVFKNTDIILVSRLMRLYVVFLLVRCVLAAGGLGRGGG